VRKFFWKDQNGSGCSDYVFFNFMQARRCFTRNLEQNVWSWS
jgi:hypothetical protein